MRYPALFATFLAALLLGALQGCASVASIALVAEDPSWPAPPDGIAPQPYTATSIRASHPVGTFTTYRVTSLGAAPLEQRTDWIESTSEGCVMAARTPPNGGEVLRSSALWWELRDHGSFPEGRTTVSRATITILAGTFDCLQYTVKLPETEGGGARHFWFDTRTAGSPVLFLQVQGGGEVNRMELVETNRRPFAPEA